MPKIQELAKIFFEFSYWNEMNGVAFKPRAYMLASESVSALGDEVEAAWRKGGIKALKELPGIGQAGRGPQRIAAGSVAGLDLAGRHFS